MQQGLSQATGAMNLFQRSANIAKGVLARDLFYAISDTTREAITLGASMDTLERSFNALAGASGATTVNIESLDKATMGMISRVDLLTQANRALALGLPVENIDKLFIGAIRLGKAMGIDATTAVEKLTLGLGRQSYRLLDDLGILIRASEANEIYAMRIGKTVDELTVAERTTAFHTVAIERLNDKVETLGDNIGDADVKLSQWDATLRNVTVGIGQMLTPLAAIAPILQSLGPAAGIVFVNLIGYIGTSIAKTTAYTGAIKGLTGAMATMGITASSLVWPLAAIAAALILVPMAIKGYTRAFEDATGRTKELADATYELESAERALKIATDEAAQAKTRYNVLLDNYNEASVASLELEKAKIEAENEATKSAEKEVKAREALIKATARLTAITEDYERTESNLVNLIKFITGATSAYTAVLKDTVYLVAGTEDAYAGLEKTLGGLQAGYDQATARVNKLTSAMNRNNRALSVNSVEQMKIRDAMQDREDASAAQIRSVENEITKIEKLAQTQGFLTFAQRKQLESLREQVKELENAGDATDSEARKLAELADEQRATDIANAELALSLEKATKAQDRHSKKVDEAQGLIDTLTSLNDTLNNVYGTQQDAVDDVTDLTDKHNEAMTEAETATAAASDAATAYSESLDTLDDSVTRALDYLDDLHEKIKKQEQAWKDAQKAKEDYDKALAAPTTPDVSPGVSDRGLTEGEGMFSDFYTGRGDVGLPSGSTINNVTNITNQGMRPEGGGSRVTVNIENVYSDNPEYMAEGLQRELEAKGIR